MLAEAISKTYHRAPSDDKVACERQEAARQIREEARAFKALRDHSLGEGD